MNRYLGHPAARHPIALTAERAWYEGVRGRLETLRRQTRRCGICDGPIEPGEETVTVDDERCHRTCPEPER